jgi:hypothetical protein
MAPGNWGHFYFSASKGCSYSRARRDDTYSQTWQVVASGKQYMVFTTLENPTPGINAYFIS